MEIGLQIIAIHAEKTMDAVTAILDFIQQREKKLELSEIYLTIRNCYRRNQMSKGKDISTMFTKEENKKNERLGYGLATRENKDVISPAQYGAFLQKRR